MKKKLFKKWVLQKNLILKLQNNFLEFSPNFFNLLDDELHGLMCGRWLTASDHSEEISNFFLRHWCIPNHKCSLEHQQLLNFPCDIVQFLPPFLCLLLGPHTRGYVPEANSVTLEFRKNETKAISRLDFLEEIVSGVHCHIYWCSQAFGASGSPH